MSEFSVYDELRQRRRPEDGFQLHYFPITQILLNGKNSILLKCEKMKKEAFEKKLKTLVKLSARPRWPWFSQAINVVLGPRSTLSSNVRITAGPRAAKRPVLSTSLGSSSSPGHRNRIKPVFNKNAKVSESPIPR